MSPFVVDSYDTAMDYNMAGDPTLEDDTVMDGVDEIEVAECIGTAHVPFCQVIRNYPKGKGDALQCICCQPVFENFSVEELRLADYSSGHRFMDADQPAGVFSRAHTGGEVKDAADNTTMTTPSSGQKVPATLHPAGSGTLSASPVGDTELSAPRSGLVADFNQPALTAVVADSQLSTPTAGSVATSSLQPAPPVVYSQPSASAPESVSSPAIAAKPAKHIAQVTVGNNESPRSSTSAKAQLVVDIQATRIKRKEAIRQREMLFRCLEKVVKFSKELDRNPPITIYDLETYIEAFIEEAKDNVAKKSTSQELSKAVDTQQEDITAYKVEIQRQEAILDDYRGRFNKMDKTEWFHLETIHNLKGMVQTMQEEKQVLVGSIQEHKSEIGRIRSELASSESACKAHKHEVKLLESQSLENAKDREKRDIELYSLNKQVKRLQTFNAIQSSEKTKSLTIVRCEHDAAYVKEIVESHMRSHRINLTEAIQQIETLTKEKKDKEQIIQTLQSKVTQEDVWASRVSNLEGQIDFLEDESDRKEYTIARLENQGKEISAIFSKTHKRFLSRLAQHYRQLHHSHRSDTSRIKLLQKQSSGLKAKARQIARADEAILDMVARAIKELLPSPAIVTDNGAEDFYHNKTLLPEANLVSQKDVSGDELMVDDSSEAEEWFPTAERQRVRGHQTQRKKTERKAAYDAKRAATSTASLINSTSLQQNELSLNNPSTSEAEFTPTPNLQSMIMPPLEIPTAPNGAVLDLFKTSMSFGESSTTSVRQIVDYYAPQEIQPPPTSLVLHALTIHSLESSSITRSSIEDQSTILEARTSPSQKRSFSSRNIILTFFLAIMLLGFYLFHSTAPSLAVSDASIRDDGRDLFETVIALSNITAADTLDLWHSRPSKDITFTSLHPLVFSHPIQLALSLICLNTRALDTEVLNYPSCHASDQYNTRPILNSASDGTLDSAYGAIISSAIIDFAQVTYRFLAEAVGFAELRLEAFFVQLYGFTLSASNSASTFLSEQSTKRGSDWKYSFPLKSVLVFQCSPSILDIFESPLKQEGGSNSSL